MVRLLAAATLSALVFAAPDRDPEQILRVGYASQYEWKEDGVKNATLEFRYIYKWGPKGESSLTGEGHVVLVDGEIARRHCPDLTSEEQLERLDEHLGWVLARFVRKPFEEAFKDLKFKGPEDSPFGTKVFVDGFAYYVEDGRIAARERKVDKKVVLVEHTTAALGGGYAITGETESYTRQSDQRKVERRRTLTTRMEKDIPAPGIYTHIEKAEEQRELTIDFKAARFNVEHPVVLQPEARDALKAAWEKRYVLPDDIRIQGQFQRRIDKDLDRSGWIGSVRGQFQLWGMDKLQIALDDSFKDRRWAQDVEKTCAKHLRDIFDLVRRTPFDEEFKGCGFELEAEGELKVVKVCGYEKALAFRLDGEEIVGRYESTRGNKGWWEIKSKSTRDGTFVPDRMTREFDDKKFQLNYRYQRSKGLQIPKKMEVLGLPANERGFGRGIASQPVLGVAEYSLRKVRVTVPKAN